MSEIILVTKTVKSKECTSVTWRNIPAGLVLEESEGKWRTTMDLKGEFWDLETYPDQDTAVAKLIDKKKALDEYRMSQLSSK
ncbi:MAG: hypothetical protein NE334_15475 [Lentisphaeraceae bacterium]|nr:hypothetical protein [Lentisphaeraceae bacterium]